MAIEWRKSYEVGVKKIDDQHKELFIKINALLDACNRHKGKEEVENTIRFLEEYVILHFGDEEKLQEENLYPEIKAHKLYHKEFVKGFEKLKSTFEEEGPTLQFVALVNRVVVDWLVKHIGNVDKAFAEYLKNKK